jgi:hypothetical protein
MHMAKPKKKRQPAVITAQQVVAALKKMLFSKSGLDWKVTGRRETPNSVPWICVSSPEKRQAQGEMSLQDRALLSKLLGLPRVPAAGIKFVGTQQVLSNLLAMCERDPDAD